LAGNGTPRREQRATDIWPIVKKNAPAFVIVGGLIVSIVTIYNTVEWMSTVVNPEAMTKWHEERTKAKADLKAMKFKADARHCVVKGLFSGATPDTQLSCLD
jgi:hypothetical protein